MYSVKMSRILLSNTALTQNDCGEFLRNLKYINFPLSQIVSTNGIVKYQIKKYSFQYCMVDSRYKAILHRNS